MNTRLLGFDQVKQAKRNALAFSTFVVLPIFCMLASSMFTIVAIAPESTENLWRWVSSHRAALLYATGAVTVTSIGLKLWLYKRLPVSLVNRWLAARGQP